MAPRDSSDTDNDFIPITTKNSLCSVDKSLIEFVRSGDDSTSNIRLSDEERSVLSK